MNVLCREWSRRGDLELVYHGSSLGVRPTLTIYIGPVTLFLPPFGVRRQGLIGFAFVVDDENSRNASSAIDGVAAERRRETRV